MPKPMTIEQIKKILLNTCEKELNQTIGFMLTDNDARIFAEAIHSAIPEQETEGVIEVDKAMTAFLQKYLKMPNADFEGLIVECKRLKENEQLERLDFDILKNEVSDIICKIFNLCDKKITEEMLNSLSNEFTDRLLRRFGLPKFTFEEFKSLISPKIESGTIVSGLNNGRECDAYIFGFNSAIRQMRENGKEYFK